MCRFLAVAALRWAREAVQAVGSAVEINNLLAAVHHKVPFYARCGCAMTMRFLREKIFKTIHGHSVAFVPNCNVLLW